MNSPFFLWELSIECSLRLFTNSNALSVEKNTEKEMCIIICYSKIEFKIDYKRMLNWKPPTSFMFNKALHFILTICNRNKEQWKIRPGAIMKFNSRIWRYCASTSMNLIALIYLVYLWDWLKTETSFLMSKLRGNSSKNCGARVEPLTAHGRVPL